MHHRQRLLGEVRANLHLAWPIVLAQLLFMSMGTVDTIFAGQLSAQTLAAVAVGSNVFFLGFVTFMGLFLALAALVAQRRGAGADAATLGRHIGGALGVAMVCGLIWALSIWLTTGTVLGWLGLSSPVAAEAERYLQVVSLATLPLCACFALRNGAEGLGHTRVALIAGVVGLVINAGGDYLLMYGRFGLPQMGTVGAAWASVTASFGMLLTYAVVYRALPALHRLAVGAQLATALRAGNPDLLRLGLPVAAILTAEAWLFQVGALMMARFGDVAVAAHQIAINFAAMSFMVPLSIGMATTVRVGQAHGAGADAAARLAGRVGIGLGVAWAVAAASLMALYPDMIVRAYTQAPEVSAMAVGLLGYAALFQLFDCIQATSNGALRGLHDTRVPMAITVLAYWAVGMPVAVGLAFFSAVGPAGIWWGFIAGLAVAAAGLSLRFLRFPLASPG